MGIAPVQVEFPEGKVAQHAKPDTGQEVSRRDELLRGGDGHTQGQRDGAQAPGCKPPKIVAGVEAVQILQHALGAEDVPRVVSSGLGDVAPFGSPPDEDEEGQHVRYGKESEAAKVDPRCIPPEETTVNARARH